MLPKVELLLDKVRKDKLDVPEVEILREGVWGIEMVHASNGRRYVYFTPNRKCDMNVLQYLLLKNGIRVSRHTTYKDCVPNEILRVLTRNLDNDNRKFIAQIKEKSQLSEQETKRYIQQIVNRSLFKQR